MPKPKSLSLVPDGAEADTPEPPKTYTITEQIRDNVKYIRELADEFDIDPAVVSQIFTTSLNYHLTKIQLGLSAPAPEGS